MSRVEEAKELLNSMRYHTPDTELMGRVLLWVAQILDRIDPKDPA